MLVLVLVDCDVDGLSDTVDFLSAKIHPCATPNHAFWIPTPLLLDTPGFFFFVFSADFVVSNYFN